MSSFTNAALVKPVIATVAKWSESEVTRMIVLLSGERTDRGPGGGGGSGDGAICIFICCTSSATLWGWEGVMGGGEDVPEGEEAETTDGTRESTRRSPRSSLSLSECGDGFDTTSSVRCPPR